MLRTRLFELLTVLAARHGRWVLLVSLGLVSALVAIFQQTSLEPSPDQPAPSQLP